jgi:HEAT repeat protein
VRPGGVFTRGTPGQLTPHGAVPPATGDAGASHALARALAMLVVALTDASVPMPDGTPRPLTPDSQAFIAVRDALRHLTARSREGPLLLRIAGQRLMLQGVPQGSIGADRWLEELRARLVAGGIGSITIREGAAPGELLTLGRGLLRASRETPSSTTPVQPMDALPREAGETPFMPQTAIDRESKAPVGNRELLRTWSILVLPAESPVEADPGVAAPTASLFGRLAAARTDAAASASVALLVDAIEDAESRGDAAVIESAARACLSQLRVVGGGAGRVALEGALRQLLRPKAMDLLASRLPTSSDSAALLQLLARGGDVAVACLLNHLLVAEDARARRSYFDGIVTMDVGAALLFDALGDERWYVVRNVAALLGEMNVEEADRALLPLLTHGDERIRIAVARALVRLRTPSALSALHRMVHDPHPELRRLAAAAYGLSGSIPGHPRPAAGPLSTALDQETDDDVALEMLAALGRLGSSHAVQRLLRIVLPSANRADADSSPRESWLRIAALEALVRARGRAMLPAIESLLGDPDSDVATAATRLYAAASGSGSA